MTDPKPPKPDEKARKAKDAELDEALDESFPASDPIAVDPIRPPKKPDED